MIDKDRLVRQMRTGTDRFTVSMPSGSVTFIKASALKPGMVIGFVSVSTWQVEHWEGELEGLFQEKLQDQAVRSYWSCLVVDNWGKAIPAGFIRLIRPMARAQSYAWVPQLTFEVIDISKDQDCWYLLQGQNWT